MDKEDKQDFCDYVSLKIYYFLRNFHFVELLDAVIEFVEDRNGNLLLFNAVVLDVADLPIPKEKFQEEFENRKVRFGDQEADLDEARRVREESQKMEEEMFERTEKKVGKNFANTIKNTVLEYRSKKKKEIAERDKTLQALKQALQTLYKQQIACGGSKMDNSKAQKLAELKVQKILKVNKKINTQKRTLYRETASFLAASRKQQRIPTAEGNWLNLSFENPKKPKNSLNLPQVRRSQTADKDSKTARNRFNRFICSIDSTKDPRKKKKPTNFEHFRLKNKEPENVNIKIEKQHRDLWVWEASSADKNRQEELMEEKHRSSRSSRILAQEFNNFKARDSFMERKTNRKRGLQSILFNMNSHKGDAVEILAKM